jgi:hypothetical protein
VKAKREIWDAVGPGKDHTELAGMCLALPRVIVLKLCILHAVNKRLP